MKKKRYPKDFNYKSIFNNLTINRKFEGGIEYIAQIGNKKFLIIDESTLSEFVDDIDNKLITIIELESEEEFHKYISKN